MIGARISQQAARIFEALGKSNNGELRLINSKAYD
jgi:hypothetical protein